MFSLLFQRSFLPFFITQFLGAFNDNLFKTALSLLIAFTAIQQAESQSSILVNLAAICFILPFFLFSPRAGALADRYEKASLIRIIKLFEVMIMCIAIIGFYTNSAWFLIAILFAMGTQSAFFGPLKYSYLPQFLQHSQLPSANAWIQGSTFIGIILGMILAGFLFSIGGEHHLAVMISVVIIACLGVLSSRFIPSVEADRLPQDGPLRDSITSLIQLARLNKPVWQAVLGISWFWMIGATYITQLPNFVRFYIGGTEQVFLFCLAMFAIGIGVGSLLCAWIRNTFLGNYLVFIGALGLLAGGLLVAVLSGDPIATESELTALNELGGHPGDVGISLGLFLLGVSGGLYIVPLYTVLQTQSDDRYRSRMVAVNNIMNAAYMVGSAVLALLLFAIGISIAQLFLILALSNLWMLWYFYRTNRSFLISVKQLMH